MPPKKVDVPEIKPLIGRVGTNLKIGIVGVPNVGKVRNKFNSLVALLVQFCLLLIPVNVLQCIDKVSSSG